MTMASLSQFIAYLVYSGIILTCFYAVYRFFLRGKTHHGFNRAYLLCSYAVAFGFLPVSKLAAWASSVMAARRGWVSIEGGASSSVAGEIPDWAISGIAGLYLCGVAVMAAVTLAGLYRIIKIRRNGVKAGDGIVIVDDQRVAPFSWGGCVYVSESARSENGGAVMVHENAHRRLRHWVDTMIAQAVIVANWFNPVAWMMLRELKDVHEYQADAAVAGSGADPREYQLMLIRSASGIKISNFANCLNHGPVSRRIDMMLRMPSGGRSMWGAMLSVPLLASVALFVNFDAMAAAMEHTTVKDADVRDVEFVVDGKQMRYDDLQSLDPSEIKSISVTKNPEAKVFIELKDK